MNRILRLRILTLLLLPLLVQLGCRSAPWTARQEFTDTITHAGTITDLARGEYEGFFPVTNLVRYGDHGLGTFHELDGEMIVYSGVVYRAASDRTASIAETNRTTPFAVVTFFEPERMFDVEHMDMPLFKRALEMRRRNTRIPEAIQIHGDFASITIRSVPAQEKPWRTLDKVIATDEQRATLEQVTGVMVGYYYPDTLSAIHPAGYHFHFLDHEQNVGGHVHDFNIQQARISIDYSPGIQVLLSTNPPIQQPTRRISPRPVPPPAFKSGE